MEQIVIYFVSGIEIYKFKAKDSEIVASLLCLGNISKDWSTDNMKKTGLTRHVYDLTVIIPYFILLVCQELMKQGI